MSSWERPKEEYHAHFDCFSGAAGDMVRDERTKFSPCPSHLLIWRDSVSYRLCSSWHRAWILVTMKPFERSCWIMLLFVWKKDCQK